MNLIEAIEKGGFPALGRPEKTIETLLSKVFFFGPRVIKVYKHVKAFYGDLSDFTFRRSFYQDDFFWNQTMSPEIYLKLGGAHAADSGFGLCDFAKGEDFYIEMSKIDGSRNLTQLLAAGKVTAAEIETLTKTLVAKLRLLTHERRSHLKNLYEIGWPSLNLEALGDLRQWMYLADKQIPRSESDRLVNLLMESASNQDYLKNFDHGFLSVAIDNNCDNLLILDGKPGFIDIMPPKMNWRVSDEFFHVCRTAADAYALGSPELGDTVYRVYANYRSPAPDAVRVGYEIRGAMIQWALRHIQGQPEFADRYKRFVEEKSKTL